MGDTWVWTNKRMAVPLWETWKRSGLVAKFRLYAPSPSVISCCTIFKQFQNKEIQSVGFEILSLVSNHDSAIYWLCVLAYMIKHLCASGTLSVKIICTESPLRLCL